MARQKGTKTGVKEVKKEGACMRTRVLAGARQCALAGALLVQAHYRSKEWRPRYATPECGRESGPTRARSHSSRHKPLLFALISSGRCPCTVLCMTKWREIAVLSTYHGGRSRLFSPSFSGVLFPPHFFSFLLHVALSHSIALRSLVSLGPNRQAGSRFPLDHIPCPPWNIGQRSPGA